MKKFMKVLCLALVLVMVMAPIASFAVSSFESVGNGDSAGTGLDQKVAKIGNDVYGVIKTIAYIVAVSMMAYMAIQWLLATPSKKAELKGRMWSMAIGVILLVGGVQILGIIQSMTDSALGNL